MKLHPQEVLAANTLLHCRTRNVQTERKSTPLCPACKNLTTNEQNKTQLKFLAQYFLCFRFREVANSKMKAEKAEFILQPDFTHNFQNICEKTLQMHFKVAVRNFYAFVVQAGDSLTDAEGCQCIVVVRWTGQLPFGLPYRISLQYQSKPLL